MIQVLHVAAECYPAAKVGGLADVVGSLPKYLSNAGVASAAVIPKYGLRWIQQQEWQTVYTGAVRLDWRHVWFAVQQEKHNTLGFPLFVVDIPGFYDRPGIYKDPDSEYAYGDETERHLLFQQAVLQWLLAFQPDLRPRVLHCHDHHTGLIPYMVKYSPEYRSLGHIPTVFTIHNGQYQGAFSWSRQNLLPFFDNWTGGMLDWSNTINPMASAIKCAWAVTTVSESYLFELHNSSLGLEKLFRDEWAKQYGIINGIDAQVWDPATDPMIQHRFDGDIGRFKWLNKQALCAWFNLPPDQPLVSFIGRMVGEKGADLLPDTYRRFLHSGQKGSFLVLGTGEAWTENAFRAMTGAYPGRFNAILQYNEALSHQIYAGSDFLIMPSRVEPCGLNQLYSMRYGTIPIVRSVGGLKDTVPDIGDPDTGRGIRFDQFTVDDAAYAIYRAASMWQNNPDIVHWLRQRLMSLDFSWENVIEKYLYVYSRMGAYIERIPVLTQPSEAPAASTPAVQPVEQVVSFEDNTLEETVADMNREYQDLHPEEDLLSAVEQPLPEKKKGRQKTPKADLPEVNTPISTEPENLDKPAPKRKSGPRKK